MLKNVLLESSHMIMHLVTKYVIVGIDRLGTEWMTSHDLNIKSIGYYPNKNHGAPNFLHFDGAGFLALCARQWWRQLFQRTQVGETWSVCQSLLSSGNNPESCGVHGVIWAAVGEGVDNVTRHYFLQVVHVVGAVSKTYHIRLLINEYHLWIKTGHRNMIYITSYHISCTLITFHSCFDFPSTQRVMHCWGYSPHPPLILLPVLPWPGESCQSKWDVAWYWHSKPNFRSPAPEELTHWGLNKMPLSCRNFNIQFLDWHLLWFKFICFFYTKDPVLGNWFRYYTGAKQTGDHASINHITMMS